MERVSDKMKKYLNKLNDKINEILISIYYVFNQSIQYVNNNRRYWIVGNLNVLYLFCPFILISQFNNDRKEIKKYIVLYFIFILYFLLQFLMNNQISILNGLVNITKLLLCFIILNYIRKLNIKINLKDIIFCISIMFSILLIISLLFKNSILWRNNDIINAYNLQRLQFLYTEPSELGFYSFLILIYIFTQFISSFQNLKDIKLVFSAIIQIITIVLAKSMGAIIIGIICLTIIMITDWIYRRNKLKNIVYTALIIILIIIIAIMIVTDNSLILRIMSMLKGNDSSFRYRINVSYQAMYISLKNTFLFGVGFGNQDNPINLLNLLPLGYVESAGITSALACFIAEGGILSVSIIIILIKNMFNIIIETKSFAKFSILIFILLYQLIGGYMTDPFYWLIYGFILNKDMSI